MASNRKSCDDRYGTGKAGFEVSLALTLAAEQDAALGVGIMRDPLDAAAARQKFLDRFLSGCRIDLGRHHALLVDSSAIRRAAQEGCRCWLYADLLPRRAMRLTKKRICLKLNMPEMVLLMRQ
jgi:hypothetical protein